MRHLLSAWAEVARQLRSAGHILLVSDYDGTLTPIVERPELAELPQGSQRLLQRLAHHRSFTVGIISGRALSDLKSRVGLDGIVFAGNHGLEVEEPGLEFVTPLAEELRPLLRLLYLAVLGAMSTIKGVLVEDKGLTLSVHYRQVEDSQSPAVKSALESVVSPALSAGKVRITTGKKVYEVRPAVDWDKGKAIELLLEKHGSRGKAKALPIYLGDDLTDEDGFRAIERHRGISIFVGDETTSSVAPYFLRSPEEVAGFLERLLGLR